MMETDTSSSVSMGILSSFDDQGILHQVAFFSKMHTPVEMHYNIHEQEQGAIIVSW
jgi:hypothetical protein